MPVRKHPLQRSCRFQPLTDDVARRPLSNRWLPLVMTQLVVDESVVREKIEQPLKIEAIGCFDIGADRRRDYSQGFWPVRGRWHKTSLGSHVSQRTVICSS